MLHQTFLFLGQLWQLFEVSQILDFFTVRRVLFFQDNHKNLDLLNNLRKAIITKRIWICITGDKRWVELEWHRMG